MNDKNRNDGKKPGKVESVDELRRRRADDSALVREALERATEGTEPRIDRLLDSVPRMMQEAGRLREQRARRDTLSASIPLARVVIPPMAAAAALLVAISAALLLTGGVTQIPNGTSIEELLLADKEVSEELIFEQIVGSEQSP